MASELPMTLPTSSVSRTAISSVCSLMSSAKRSRMRFFSVAGLSRQRPSSKAVRAAVTAALISAASQSATLPATEPSIDEILSKVLPDLAGTYSPLIKARPSGTVARARAIQASFVVGRSSMIGSLAIEEWLLELFS